MENKIIKVHFEGGEFIDSKNGKIECFTKNGKMAPVDWYRQNTFEFNGKYVLSVEYKKPITNPL